MRNRIPADEGTLALYGIILLTVILVTLAAFTLIVYPSFASGASSYSSFLGTTDNPVLVGSVNGYADNTGVLGNIPVENPSPDSQRLGAVQMTIRLDSVNLILDKSSGVNLDLCTVTFVSPFGREQLRMVSDRPMQKPGWTITSKTGTLPYQSADADNILEPNEQFSLFVYPSHALPPQSWFRVFVDFPNSKEIQINNVVPSTVTPVMNFKYAGPHGPL